MNLATKKNLWITQTVQIVRMANSGSDWAQKSGGSCAGSPVTPGEKPSVVIRVDRQEESDPTKTMAYATTERSPATPAEKQADVKEMSAPMNTMAYVASERSPATPAEKQADVKEMSAPMNTIAYVASERCTLEEGVCKSGGSCAGSTVTPGEKLVDIKEGSDPMKTMAYVTPQPVNAEVEREHVRMTTAQAKALTKQDELDKESGEFLTRYYGDQVKYFRKMAKVNNSAMKRIKKLRKDWLKFCEKHF